MAAYDIVEGEGTTRSLRMDSGAKDNIQDDYNFTEDTEKLKK